MSAPPVAPEEAKEVHTEGHFEPPQIPLAVLASPLFPVWENEAWLREDWIGSPAGGYDAELIKEHDSMRFVVTRLLEVITTQCLTGPMSRSKLIWRERFPYKDRVYAYNPFEETVENLGNSSGKVDICLLAQLPNERRFPVKNVAVLIEIRSGDLDEGVTPAQARDVDQQVRRRANAARDNDVINDHLYLIGWIGCWFRPYYWCRQEGTIEQFEPNRNPGLMRPSDSDLHFFASRVNPGPRTSLWRDIRDPANQKLLQQILMDGLNASDGLGPAFPEMYGEVCQTVSRPIYLSSFDGSPSSGDASRTTFSDYGNEVVLSSGSSEQEAGGTLLEEQHGTAYGQLAPICNET